MNKALTLALAACVVYSVGKAAGYREAESIFWRSVAKARIITERVE